MTLPDTPAARKPRRLGLIIPWALAGVLVIVWSGGWFWLKGETIRKMDAARAQAAQAGWRLDWTSRKLSGFPFRLNVDLTDARWGDSAGWSVTAPVLNAQAYVSRTDSWMLLAPEGVVVSRASFGPVVVKAEVLRGSVSDLGRRPPRISVEAMGLRLDALTGSQPIGMSAAREFHFHTRAGPADQGAFYVEVDQATGGTGTNPENTILDAIYNHASALQGRNISSAVQAWKRAGGSLNFRQTVAPPGSMVADLPIESRWGGKGWTLFPTRPPAGPTH